MIKIRNFEKSDLSQINYLQPDGWKDIIYYFKFFEEANFCFPVVAEVDNKIVGIANCLLNKDSGWISHIIVSDKFRNQGLGFKLTKHVMEILAEKNCISQLLIATKMGENLYERLGFKKSNLYNFYIGKQLNYPINDNIRLLNNSDIGEILELDLNLSGEVRENMILQFIYNGYVYEKNNSGKILGYFLPDLGDGVVLASNINAGIELLKLKHTLYNCKTVLPETNQAGKEFFVQNGFELDNQAYRMVYGEEVDWKPQSVFCRIGGFYA